MTTTQRVEDIRLVINDEGTTTLEVRDTNGLEMTPEFLAQVNAGETTAVNAAISAAVAAQHDSDLETFATPSDVSTAVSEAVETQHTTDLGIFSTPASVTTAISAQHETDNATYAAFLTPTATKTGPYTAAARDLVKVDTTGGNVTITLPTGAAAGTLVGVLRMSAGANTLTVQRGGSDVIASGTGTVNSQTLTLQDRTVIYQADGAGTWTPVYGYQALAAMDARYASLAQWAIRVSTNTGGGDNVHTALTTGGYNTAVGRNAQKLVTTGSNNVGVSAQCQAALTTGSNNTAVGFNTQMALTTGSESTAFGAGVQNALTSGVMNVGVGAWAQTRLTTGDSNTHVGYNSGNKNTTGRKNTGIGETSLYNMVDGNFNCGIGQGALFSQTTGEENTAVGAGALYLSTTPSYNTSVGGNASFTPPGGQSCATTTGARNTHIGWHTGQASATQRSYTVCLGSESVVDGDGAVAIGAGASAGAAGAVAIGRDHTGTAASTTTQDVIALGTAAHQVQIANNATGAGSAALGANCPAVTATAPYTWLKLMCADGSTVYAPVWK